ncbi:hypothetical protein GCM10023178_29190 [Actinomadura luteofluorescens]
MAWVLHLVSGFTASELALKVELAGRIAAYRMVMARRAGEPHRPAALFGGAHIDVRWPEAEDCHGEQRAASQDYEEARYGHPPMMDQEAASAAPVAVAPGPGGRPIAIDDPLLR